MGAPAPVSIGPPPDASSVDQCIVLRGVSWEHYEALLAIRGDDAGPRMTYFRGTLEIMSPSAEHESVSRMFDRLLCAFAEELGIELNAFGSWTQKHPPDRGLEPDECFVVGARTRSVPDLAVEVVWTAGLGSKLDVYRGLGVPEVWVWDSGVIVVRVLRAGGYSEEPRSELLPALDLELLASFVTRTDQIAAIREFRAALRQRLSSSRS
jgi:Uma2 family endonuclease